MLYKGRKGGEEYQYQDENINHKSPAYNGTKHVRKIKLILTFRNVVIVVTKEITVFLEFYFRSMFAKKKAEL